MKMIKLTGKNCEGKFTLVDDEILELIGKFKWNLHTGGYAWRPFWNNDTKKYKSVYLHRFAMNAQKGQEVDHINRNKLDNRKENLRFCTRSENMHNVAYENRTKHLGAVWHKQNHYWTSKIRLNGKRIHLGIFHTIKEAQEAYFTAKRSMYA